MAFIKWFSKTLLFLLIIIEVISNVTLAVHLDPDKNFLSPLVRTVDLDIGEVVQVELHNGEVAEVEVISVSPKYDSVVKAIRDVDVTIRLNGEELNLHVGNYRLPVTAAGVQIDSPVTLDYLEQSTMDWWGLRKDVRLRLWPENSPLIWPGTFVYPVDQVWLPTMTWYSNEPVSLRRPNGKIYYHAGLDIGGAEDMVSVFTATDGIVVSAGDDVYGGIPDDNPIRARYDVVYVQDARGWYYRYSHLHSIEPSIHAGMQVRAGDKLGMLGKEGGSGGWTHLHFHIESRQPSGLWGIQDGYAFLWQAYQDKYEPAILANARPHHAAYIDETVTLSGKNTWSKKDISSWDWILSDGSIYHGKEMKVSYDRPGLHSEVLKVTDVEGNYDYDFATIRVFEEGSTADEMPVSIHATYFPTHDLRPGDTVYFQVRSSGTEEGYDVWDFDDGSGEVVVKSDIDSSTHAKVGYSVVPHRFQRSGDYLVKVSRDSQAGIASTYLHVFISDE